MRHPDPFLQLLASSGAVAARCYLRPAPATRERQRRYHFWSWPPTHDALLSPPPIRKEEIPICLNEQAALTILGEPPVHSACQFQMSVPLLYCQPYSRMAVV